MRLSKPTSVVIAGERELSFQVTVNETQQLYVTITAEAVLNLQPEDIKPEDMKRATEIISRDPNHKIVGALMRIIPAREGEGDSGHPIFLTTIDFNVKG